MDRSLKRVALGDPDLEPLWAFLGKTPPNTGKHRRLDAALDKLRARYGRKVIYYGSVQESRDEAPMRIAFTHIPNVGLEQD